MVKLLINRSLFAYFCFFNENVKKKDGFICLDKKIRLPLHCIFSR